MRRLTRLTVRVQRALLLTGVLLLGAVGARAQSAKGGKIDPTWLRADAASKTVEFKLVAGLSEANGGMNFNGFGRGALVLTVPQGWNVVLHFKNQDPNLPHSVESDGADARDGVGVGFRRFPSFPARTAVS